MFLNLFNVLIDIRNLYSSRDSLWKELFKLQQTEKRRDRLLRQRLHNLERKVNSVQPRG